MKKLALMFAGAASIAVAAPAMAQTANFGFNGTFGLSSGLGNLSAPATLSGTIAVSDLVDGSPFTISNFTGTAFVLGQTDTFNLGTGSATLSGNQLSLYQGANENTFLGTFALSAPFTMTGTSASAMGTLVSGAQDLGFLGLGAAGLQSGSGTFSLSAATGAVPEAATWGMMILGMGMVGFAMRRAKVATRVSFAG